MTKEEFISVLLPQKNLMFRMAFSLLKNVEEAEDAVQEAFVKVWNTKMKIRDVKNPKAFLISITRNHCLDKLKSRKEIAFTLNDAIIENRDNSPEIQTEQSQLVIMVRRLIELLPEQQKTVLHLRDVEGLSFEEIAKITGWELNYLRVNLSRGRKKIKESLIKLQNYETART